MKWHQKDQFWGYLGTLGYGQTYHRRYSRLCAFLLDTAIFQHNRSTRKFFWHKRRKKSTGSFQLDNWSRLYHSYRWTHFQNFGIFPQLGYSNHEKSDIQHTQHIELQYSGYARSTWLKHIGWFKYETAEVSLIQVMNLSRPTFSEKFVGQVPKLSNFGQVEFLIDDFSHKELQF